MKGRNASRIKCDCRKKFTRLLLRPVVIHGTKCWTIMKHVHKISVIEIRMLRWINGNIRKDKIQNEEFV